MASICQWKSNLWHHSPDSSKDAANDAARWFSSGQWQWEIGWMASICQWASRLWHHLPDSSKDAANDAAWLLFLLVNERQDEWQVFANENQTSDITHLIVPKTRQMMEPGGLFFWSMTMRDRMNGKYLPMSITPLTSLMYAFLPRISSAVIRSVCSRFSSIICVGRMVDYKSGNIRRCGWKNQQHPLLPPNVKF